MCCVSELSQRLITAGQADLWVGDHECYTFDTQTTYLTTLSLHLLLEVKVNNLKFPKAPAQMLPAVAEDQCVFLIICHLVVSFW